MSDKPIPCPYPKSNGGVWCNHKRYVMATSTRQESFYVKCTCGARGPLTDTRAEAIARWNAAGQDTRRLDWYLRRSRVRGWDHDRTSIETGSDYLSGIRKWIDECLG